MSFRDKGAVGIRVGGRTICVHERGEGLPLLQIHGLGLGKSNFAAISPLLGEHFRVVDYDMSGFGQSDPAAADVDYSAWADEAAALLDALEIGRAVVHATSGGGPVGIDLAARRPDRVEALIVSASMGRYDRQALIDSEIKRQTAEQSGMRAVATLTALQAFTREFFDSEAFPAAYARMLAAFGSLDAADWCRYQRMREVWDAGPGLSRISCPTMFVTGALDVMTPLVSGPTGLGMKQMHDLVPGSELIELEDVGHLILVEGARRTTQEIVSFMNRIGLLPRQAHAAPQTEG